MHGKLLEVTIDKQSIHADRWVSRPYLANDSKADNGLYNIYQNLAQQFCSPTAYFRYCH